MSEWDYTNERVLFWMEILNGYVQPLPRRILNIYGSTPMILLTMRPSRLFVKIRCHAVASTRKRSAVRKNGLKGLRKTPESATSVLTTTPHQQEDSEPLNNACYITTRLIVFWVCEKRCLHTTTPRQQQSSQPRKIYQASVDVSECLLKESSGSSTRPIDDRTHSFKWGSREEDDTEGSYPSPNHHASPTGTL
ncbi:hypothetical protein TNCV_2430581 [Trichonephila clavipes]|nr:hypothetical protein TNCV_2430581 [Trichonephila clavipes]